MKRPVQKKKSIPKRMPKKPLQRLLRDAVRIPRKTARLSKSPLAAAPINPEMPQAHSYGEENRLPIHYGDDKLVLLVRDPWWLFAYWEVTPRRVEEVQRTVREKGCGHQAVLRVYDVTGLVFPQKNSFFDIELKVQADHWYVDVGAPNREWIAEIGVRLDNGEFLVWTRSNRVRTPGFGLSDVLDEEWMLPEDIYALILGRSLGSGSGGSLDIRSLLEKYLRNVVSSEASPQIAKSRV